jgi:transcriptional regulator with XRE-family HTH domain
MLKNTKIEVGKRFKSVRELDLKLTQMEITPLLGYKTQSAYSKIEKGGNYPSATAYESMSKLSKVRMAWLAYEDGEKFMTEDEYNKFLENFKVVEIQEDTPSVFVSHKESLKAELEQLKIMMNELEKKIDKL